jgi:hypothetical protein
LLHQHIFALTPEGDIASFIFVGLNTWSEQDTLMAANG